VNVLDSPPWRSAAGTGQFPFLEPLWICAAPFRCCAAEALHYRAAFVIMICFCGDLVGKNARLFFVGCSQRRTKQNMSDADFQNNTLLYLQFGAVQNASFVSTMPEGLMLSQIGSKSIFQKFLDSRFVSQKVSMLTPCSLWRRPSKRRAGC